MDQTNLFVRWRRWLCNIVCVSVRSPIFQFHLLRQNCAVWTVETIRKKPFMAYGVLVATVTVEADCVALLCRSLAASAGHQDCESEPLYRPVFRRSSEDRVVDEQTKLSGTRLRLRTRKAVQSRYLLHRGAGPYSM